MTAKNSDQTANPVASDNFSGFLNLKIIHCDGLDVFDSFRAMREAVDYIRSGAGCAIVYAPCVRIHSHSNSDRQELYRSPDELAAAEKSGTVANVDRAKYDARRLEARRQAPCAAPRMP